MNFTTNQNHHLYVAPINGVSDFTAKTIGTGKDKQLFFIYEGSGHETLRTDLITIENIDYIKYVKAETMRVPLKVVKVALDSNVNSGNVIAGQDYVLRIAFRQFHGMSDEDQYFKYGAVHATSAMVSTPLKFYQALADSLNKNFSREVGATGTSNPYLKFTATSNGLTIKELPQAWTRGVQVQERVYFDVYPTTVFDGTDDVTWGTVTDQTPTDKSALTVTGSNPTGIGNGTKIADLEWFCLGERGDQYRYKGWPNYIPTNYQVDPSLEYDVIEIHHAFIDWGNTSYRSEKDITLVFKKDSTEIAPLITAIESATGLTVEQEEEETVEETDPQ